MNRKPRTFPKGTNVEKRIVGASMRHPAKIRDKYSCTADDSAKHLLKTQIEGKQPGMVKNYSDFYHNNNIFIITVIYTNACKRVKSNIIEQLLN